MRWLIVEEALRDRKGHWFEAIATFRHGFRERGDEVMVLADSAVDPDIRELLDAVPVLPTSIWHLADDSSGRLVRYSRVFTHAWRVWRTVGRYVDRNTDFDAIFVPSTGLHHLLAWAWLIKRKLRYRPVRVLLFFLILPIRWNPDSGETERDGSPTSRLFFRLLKWLEPEVRSGRVILGAEVEEIRVALETLSGVPATLFPQIVIPFSTEEPDNHPPDEEISMGCYGPSRAEKGTDVLQEAIAIYCRRFPAGRARFLVHWTQDFVAETGRRVTRLPELMRDPRVQFLTHFFAHGEYEEQLSRTQVMLLPYRLSGYRLRGSRVVMEAMVNGMPVIATRGTSLASLVETHGAGLFCEDGDPESLALAIREMEERFEELRQAARSKMPAAAREFSIDAFRRTFLQPGPAVRTGVPCVVANPIG
jgi:glycosyltransferase involved in cell wall biosynthesis